MERGSEGGGKGGRGSCGLRMVCSQVGESMSYYLPAVVPECADVRVFYEDLVSQFQSLLVKLTCCSLRGQC